MKFRCERDDLVEASSTAGRAVPAGAGRSRCSAASASSSTGDHASADRHRPRPHHPVADDRHRRQRRRGGAPGRLVADIVRALEPGRGESWSGRRRAAHRRRAVASSRCGPSRPTSSPGCPSPSGDAVTLPAEALAEALRQVPAASSEEHPADPDRRADGGRGGGLRLVATDSYRLAVRDLRGVGVLAEGQRVLVPSRALKELMRLLGRRRARCRLRLGEHDATFAVGQRDGSPPG